MQKCAKNAFLPTHKTVWPQNLNILWFISPSKGLKRKRCVYFRKNSWEISLKFLWNTHKFMWKPGFCQRINFFLIFLKEKLSAEIFINLAKVSKQWQFALFFFTIKRNCENLQHFAFSQKCEKSFFVSTLSSFFFLFSCPNLIRDTGPVCLKN